MRFAACALSELSHPRPPACIALMASILASTTKRTLLTKSWLCSTGPSSQITRPFVHSAQRMKADASKEDPLLWQLAESAMAQAEEEDPSQASTTILKNLKTRTVISPSKLSPKHLLIPYLPKPDLTQAYPLGPPKKEAFRMDPFVRFGIDPLDSPMNPYLRSQFCTEMGKIKSRGKTGLQRSSQRRMGKAVRRARSMGIIPTFGVSLPSR